MRNSLFWRLFSALLGALVVTVVVLALTMVTMVRTERRQALENEVRLQARDVAQLIKQRGLLSFWQDDAGLKAALNWKIEEIRDNYHAEVWLINATGYVIMLGDTDTTEKLTDPEVIAQIQKVLSGEEIRVQGLIPELGDNMVTIGVPWYGSDDRVFGAVLLHIGLSSLEVDYSDIIRYVSIAGVLSMGLGTILAYLIASRQSKPLRRIQRAVADFSAGRFDQRVEVMGHDEMAQLAQSFNRMAEDLNNLEESRRAFVANVSHELRSPMTSIQGYIQGMLDGTIPAEEQGRYLTVVLDETQRLTKLVNGLLELSKFESGAIPLNMTRFDVNELILSTLFKFEQRIEKKELDVAITFREKPCFVMADADRITQVVSNLIDNAVKFARQGGQLAVWTHTAEGLCYVTIRDEGAGIPPQDMPFIFERFYKGDKAHTSGMGTGLGLAIVKKILEQHGQTITASSSAGSTSMIFTLKKSDG